MPALADDNTTNNLNQYTARENNTLVVAGTVASSAVNVVVTPSGGTPQAAGRAGGFWGTEVTPANASGPVQQSVTVVGALSSSGASASVSSESVSTAVPAASEAYTYDHDGSKKTSRLDS